MAEEIVLTQEEQEEQIKQWLKKNVPAIAVGISLGLALTYGFNYYKDLRESQAKQASALYEEILSSENTPSQAAEEVELFKSDYSHTPYAAKVSLLSAKKLAESGKLEEAVKELAWVVKNADEDLVIHTAQLRQAQLLISLDKLTEAESLLNVKDTQGLDSHYKELSGDIAAKKNEYGEASALYLEALESSLDNRYKSYLQLKINKMNSLLKAQ